MIRCREAWFGVLLLASAGPASSRAAEVPVCTPEDRETWKGARLVSLGVAGSDRDRNLLPDALPGDDCLSVVDFSLAQEGRANDGFHSWVYAAGCKQTFCGRPASFEKNLAFAFLSGEHDLNNNLVPEDGSSSRKLLAERFCFDAHPPGSTRPALEAPRLCLPLTEHVHAEITPPRGLRDLLGRLWLAPEDWTSWRERLSEQQMCVYGPFVGDTGHAVKAEIHPTQLIWWNENQQSVRGPDAPDGPYALFLVQDASSRYSKRHHFVLMDPLPAESKWRPWAQGPVHGRFAIPFWVGAEKPVRFRLLRYPSPRRGLPPAQAFVPVAGRIQDGTTSVELVVVKNETKLPRSYRLDILPEVLCKECEGDADCKEHPSRTRGYRARLVIDAEVGRDFEWEEGHLALLLCDERIDCGASAPEKKVPPPPLRIGGLQSLVTWRADRKSWRGLPGGEEASRVEIDRMFERVSWPDWASHPDPELRLLGRVDLRAKAAIAGLTEKEEKRMKTTADWGVVRACRLLEPTVCEPLSYEEVSGTEARLRLPTVEPAVVREIELTVTVAATVPDLAPASPEQRPLSESLAPRTDHWTLWSHGFAARNEGFWNGEVSRLCAGTARRKVTEEQMLRGHAHPDVRDPAAASRLEPLLPLRNVRHLVRTMVADDIVTMAELRTLVEQVGRLCGFESPLPTQSQWQAAY